MATAMATATATGPEAMILCLTTVRRCRRGLLRGCGLHASLLACAVLAAFPSQSQESAGAERGRAWIISPRISVTETFTDNGRLNSSRGTSGSEQITQISPGIHIQGASARLKAYFDYSLNQLYYAEQSQGNKTQNALTAFGTLEAVDNWLFIDASGTISQTSISAFGTQSSSNTSVNGNSTETSMYRFAPYVRGHVLDFAEYQLRYDVVTSRTEGATSTNSDSETWSAQLRGATPMAAVNWQLDAIRQAVERSTGRNNETERYFGNLYWQPERQWRLRLAVGRETNNFINPDGETRTTRGYGFEWRPTDRTNLTVFKERRFFGDGHSINFSHRTPLTAWRFSDTRDVMAMSNSGSVTIGTLYDLLLALVSPEITDPLVRAALVDRIFQQNPGLSRDARIYSDYLTSLATVSRTQSLTAAITGARNTVTFAISQSRRQRIADQSLAVLTDSFSNASEIRQRGATISWSHKLTPLSTLSSGISASSTDGQGGSAGDVHSTQKSMNVTFSTRLGVKTNASLGLRRTVFESDTANHYTDNTVTGALTAHF